MSAAEELSPTACLILGVLAFHPHSGYGIKKVADESLRSFSNVSFAQIYPELQRLRKRGLIEPDPASSAGGGRKTMVFRLTKPGRSALRSWLTDPRESPVELRDEMLVKLFFSDALTKSEFQAHLYRMQARAQAHLEAIEAGRAHLRDLPHGSVRGPSVVADAIAAVHRGYRTALQRARRRD